MVFDFAFKERFKSVVFPLWRRDAVLKLQIAAICGAALQVLLCLKLNVCRSQWCVQRNVNEFVFSSMGILSMIPGVRRPAVYREAKLEFAVCGFRATLVECRRRRTRGGVDAVQSDSASDATETYYHTRRPPPWPAVQHVQLPGRGP